MCSQIIPFSKIYERTCITALKIHCPDVCDTPPLPTCCGASHIQNSALHTTETMLFLNCENNTATVRIIMLFNKSPGHQNHRRSQQVDNITDTGSVQFPTYNSVKLLLILSLRYRGSITSRGKGFVSSPTCPDMRLISYGMLRCDVVSIQYYTTPRKNNGYSAVLQIGRSLVRSQLVSMDFH